MRLLAFFACSAAVALLGVGIALAAEPTTGTLSVEHGRGAVLLDLRGSALGRLAAGTLIVTDKTPNDRFAALVVGRKVTEEQHGPRTVLYRGAGLRFRMLGGAYRVKVRGAGIDISAVGRGSVTLAGEPRVVDEDAGLYSFDGVDCGDEPLLCLPLPLEPTRFSLGPSEESSTKKAAP